LTGSSITGQPGVMQRSCPVLIVSGDRRRAPEPPARDVLAHLLNYLQPKVVVHGGGGATDDWAGATAQTHGFEVKVFDARWGEAGRAAGPIRNRQMAKFAKDQGGGYCILFPGGAGTLSMYEEAKKLDLAIIDLRYLDKRHDEPQQGLFR